MATEREYQQRLDQFATLLRAMLEEFPVGLGIALRKQPMPVIDRKELDGGTRARVSWTLAGRMNQTRVRLAADVESAAPIDRVLLALGGLVVFAASLRLQRRGAAVRRPA